MAFPLPRFGLKIFTVSLLSAGFYLVIVSSFSNSIADYDLWGYLAFGRIFWEEGYFPFRDAFAYTPTNAPWIYHEWLAGVFFYPIYKFTGDAGLQLLRYVVILLTLFLMYATSLTRCDHKVWGLVSLLPAMVLISFGYFPVRAQIFTYFFFVLTLLILETVKKEGRLSLLWWLLPVQILWCNLHGGFVSGLGLIFIYALGQILSKRTALPLFLAGCAAALGTLINPYGVRYWSFMIQAVSMPRPEISEWISVLEALQTRIYELPASIFLSMVLLLLILYLFRRQQDKTDLLVLIATVYVGLTHIRHSVFFGLIFGAYLSIVLDEHWRAFKEAGFHLARRPWIPGSILMVLLVLTITAYQLSGVVKAAPSFQLLTPSPYYPTGACRWIVQNAFQGNILPHFEWGEFLSWHLHPFCRVAMDGRYETVYERQYSEEYFLFLRGKNGGQKFLERYPHDMVMIRPNTPAEKWLIEDPSWGKIHADSTSVVYLRKKRPHSALSSSRIKSP